MKRRYKQKAESHKRIALERINILFKEAGKIFKEDPGLANRYVFLARELAMKYKIKMPRELKRRFCKHCRLFLVPNINVRIRTREGKVVYYCLNCKKFMRFPYLRERESRRKAK